MESKKPILETKLRGIGHEQQDQGCQKGDRLTVYMPTCPEAIMLMLATVRIGAIHSVVFAGFGAGALADRIEASGSRLVFTKRTALRIPKPCVCRNGANSSVPGGLSTPAFFTSPMTPTTVRQGPLNPGRTFFPNALWPGQ